jgi:hypothetical protein
VESRKKDNNVELGSIKKKEQEKGEEVRDRSV